MHRIPLRRVALAAALAMLAGVAGAAEDLPLPRFVSLRSNEVNLRTGPGTNYPVDWVMVRKGMPVEVLAEFDIWRKIRDWQGTVGWVHQSMLAGARTALVTGATRTLLSEPERGRPVARIEAGVIGKLLECVQDWCRLEVQGHRGWLKRGEFFGVYPNETVK
ncbi:MAG: SH3 domain-containing protein [Dongiaceae bacterium]